MYAVGAEVQTFNIPGVKEHACFMKELADAERVKFPRVPLSIAYLSPSHILSCKENLWIVSNLVLFKQFFFSEIR